jgi:ATP-binding cassette subfamily B protein
LLDVTAGPSVASQALIEVQDVIFRYADRVDPVLRGCSLHVKVGDRLLLEGASGSGKSTLGSLIAGWRRPNSGLLLVRGLDQQILGAEKWRQIVAAAPQFHENYILTASFGFNLLMARRGILNTNDLQEAENICKELGLGGLLERMPAGLLQQVGETGWQLSHGERSRLYIARTLLQRADMVVLDESFVALDPENLRLTLSCVMKHATTVLAIAHR